MTDYPMQVQHLRNEARAQAIPQLNQNQEVTEPPRYAGPHLKTVAIFCLVVFLTWVLAMLMQQRAEQDEHNRAYMDLMQQLAEQNEHSRAHMDQLFRLLQEQVQGGQ